MKKLGLVGGIDLLGTIFTMKGAFFKKSFDENGIEVIVPTDNEMQYIIEENL